MNSNAVNLIAVPFLIGSVPLALSVIIGNRFLKSYRESNKFVFWGGITASAFVGWTVSNMIMARYTESEVFNAERECNVCDSDSQSFCGKCRNHKGSCCRCVGSSDWEEMQREFPEVPYDAESMKDKSWKYLGDLHYSHNMGGILFPQMASNLSKTEKDDFMRFAEKISNKPISSSKLNCDHCNPNGDNIQRQVVSIFMATKPTSMTVGRKGNSSIAKFKKGEIISVGSSCVQGLSLSAESFNAEGEMIKVSATLTPDFWEDIMNGDESINEVDWEIESAESFSADQFPSMHYGDHNSDAQEKYQEFVGEWDGDDDPPSFEEWYMMDFDPDYEITDEQYEDMERVQEEDYQAMKDAESKFKPPYMKGDRLDTTRGNDGKFRRRLVVPLEKNA